MTTEFSDFTAHLRQVISSADTGGREAGSPSRATRKVGGGSLLSVLNSTTHQSDAAEGVPASRPASARPFRELALQLFALQFEHNTPYRRFCVRRGATPDAVRDWRQIPALPTSAFKELELSCLAPADRAVVFHSSGTTQSRPSRHFHNAESLAIYERSLLAWFRVNVLAGAPSAASTPDGGRPAWRLLGLTPSAAAAPHSSLVHMFETVRRTIGAAGSLLVGQLAADGAWELDFARICRCLSDASEAEHPVVLLGTAFSFVHLLDHLAAAGLRFALPPGSRVMETGGYKGRSRLLPKTELHALIASRLGVPPSRIVCEYGMSELGSQAYDRTAGDEWQVTGTAAPDEWRVARDGGNGSRPWSLGTRHFRFPPWARAQIVSPETGQAVSEGETGLIRVFDLANVFSVLAIQTEDLAIRRGDGFELLGRAALAEARGCSLMAA